ncbi:MAG: hypothetical protein LBP27_04805, partial [Treponema sp.]|nr:hypothetical protein [Treponema sp.]
MNHQTAWLALLGIFSSLSMNVMLQCGLGMRQIAVSPEGGQCRILKAGIVFATSLFLWLVFTSVLSGFPLGFFTYILVFPLSSLIYFCLEIFLYRVVLKKKAEGGETGFCDGLA